MGKVKNYYHDEICRMAEEDNFPDDIEYQIWNEAEKPKIQTTQKPIKETNMTDLINRMEEYTQEHCWQYDIRINNLQKDMELSGLPTTEIEKVRVSDIQIKNITDKSVHKDMIAFIQKHEWLGNISQYPTHWFCAYYKGLIVGVLILNQPNAFSKLLGEDTPELERLISRGACISWSPKCLASFMIMWSIKWMVKNTKYRLFTAYSDPTAFELGTVYQASNFYYLGQKSGAAKRYINPYTGKLVSDRYFRQKTAYKKYAQELGIKWKKDWNHSTGMQWSNVPQDIEKKLRDFSKEKQKLSECHTFPPKHKYAYLLGNNKKETKDLRSIFLGRNKVRPYPKERGV
jgi:hypothetical protein